MAYIREYYLTFVELLGDGSASSGLSQTKAPSVYVEVAPLGRQYLRKVPQDGPGLLPERPDFGGAHCV